MPRPELELLMERKVRAKLMLIECIHAEDWAHLIRVGNALREIESQILKLK